MEDFKKDIDSSTIIVGDFNTALSKRIDLSNKISTKILSLNNECTRANGLNWYIERAFDPKEEKYTFFSNAHGTFSKIDHIIGCQTSLNTFKTIEII